MSALANIEHLETDLWDAADNLRANSKLTAGEYCMPVLGVTFAKTTAGKLGRRWSAQFFGICHLDFPGWPLEFIGDVFIIQTKACGHRRGHV